MNIHSIASLIAFLVCTSLSAFVFFRGRRSNVHNGFIIVTQLTGIWSLFPFLILNNLIPVKQILLVRAVYLAAIFDPTAFLYFSFALVGIENKRRPIIMLSLLISLILSVFGFSPLFIKDIVRSGNLASITVGPLYHLYMLFFVSVCLYTFYNFLSAYKVSYGILRNQLEYVFIGFGIAYIGGLMHLANIYFKYEPFPHDFLIILFVLIIYYAIVKYRLMDIDIVFKKGITYTTLITLTLLPGFAIILLAEDIFFGQINYPFSILILLGLISGAFAFYAMRLKTERAVEKRIFSKKYRYHETIMSFSKDIISILDLDELLKSLDAVLTKSLDTSELSVFLIKEGKDTYGLAHSSAKRDEPAIVGDLEDMGRIWLKEELTWKEANIKRLMGMINAEVFIPLRCKGKAIGFLTLGEKNNGGFYSYEELNILSALSNQAAVAIDNARLIKELDRSKDLLRRSEQLSLIGNLAVRIAHEIRNPLVAIGTFIQMLPYKYSDPEFRENFYNIALEEVNRINDLITEMLDLTKNKVSRFQSENIHRIIEKMLLLASPKAKEKGISIIKKYDTSIPNVMLDVEKIKQVFLNLFYNAIEFNREGGQIAVVTRLIDSNNNHSVLRVDVKDTGIGIPAENIERIFDPYFTTKHKSPLFKGTGLGLFISNQYILEHMGWIQVESTIDKGTTFAVHFPIEKGNVGA